MRTSGHLTVEELLAFRRGEKTPMSMLIRAVHHLSETCPDCSEEFQAMRVALRACEPHWLSLLSWQGVREMLERGSVKLQRKARREVRFLEKQSTWPARLRCIAKSRTRFREPETVYALIQRSQLEEDKTAAARWANLAQKASLCCRGDAPRTLVALATAHYGNALRCAGRLREAKIALKVSMRLVQRLHGEPYAEAEVGSLKASLLRDVGDYTDASDLLLNCVAIYEELGELVLAGHQLVNLTNTEDEAGRLAGAENAGRMAYRFTQIGGGDRWATLCSAHALAQVLSQREKFREAAKIFSRHQNLYEAFPQTEGRRLWLAGTLAAGDGQLEKAEGYFQHARVRFDAEGSTYDAARVGLSLALVYVRQGRHQRVTALAASMVSEFRSEESSNREALAALILFQQAASREGVTASLSAALSRYLQRAQRQPGAVEPFRFEEPSGG